jgi:hypothetical protein
MKKRAKFILVLISMLLLVPAATMASTTVFETTGFIIETDGIVFPFIADLEPLTYKATLTDLSVNPLQFEELLLIVSTSTEVLATANAVANGGVDIAFFPVDLDQQLFANVAGKGIGTLQTGLFGLKIEAVPVPQAVWLLGSGLVALVMYRRRKQ